MWDGYAFAMDFREERGHAYMLDDQTFTERQEVVKQPGTCINCHASAYTAYKTLGNGDILKGFEEINQMPYFEARKQVTHPVACIDCHDSQTMALRVTRPAFMEGMRALKASQGVQNYDVNTMATRQEMRSFVCGQCHVEYYFKGPEKRLVVSVGKGPRRSKISSRTTTRCSTRTGPTPIPARPCSRRSIPSSRCGTRAFTPAPASRAPTATCRTSATAR